MICDLLTPRGPRAPSVQGRASPYMFMHKLLCCACFYYVALSRNCLLSMRTSVYPSALLYANSNKKLYYHNTCRL